VNADFQWHSAGIDCRQHHVHKSTNRYIRKTIYIYRMTVTSFCLQW